MCQTLGSVDGKLIDWAAGVVGIPCTVVRAQIDAESGGQLNVASSAGALGPAQFLPSTWQGLGCTGSEYNANDAMKCYAKYMYQLVQSYHGNVRNALAAYNAGPGNLQAGYGYADGILRAAGQGQGLTAGAGSGAAAPSSSASSSDGSSGQAGPECLWAIGGQHISILFGHGPSLPSACLVRKSEARAVVGAALLLLGALAALPGIVIIVAYGFSQTQTGQAVTQAAQAVPGYGTAARVATSGTRTMAARRAGARQGRTSATRTAARRQAARAARQREAARAQRRRGEPRLEGTAAP